MNGGNLGHGADTDTAGPAVDWDGLAGTHGTTAGPALLPTAYPIPEDRGLATVSDLGGVEYVEDLIRPGRIVVWAAEEGTGKSFAVAGELAIRLCAAGGDFAGTWPVCARGPVLVLSEMHEDDDFSREATVLASLRLDRTDLQGRYYRLPLATAANGAPALMDAGWRAHIVAWLRERGVLLLVVDTATGATQVDPWGTAIQTVYQNIKTMVAEVPALAVVLVLHLKKPSGRGRRGISDVLGEWGRFCDVVVLHESEGRDDVHLSTHKRVQHPRRIRVTKVDGLLVDPVDLDAMPKGQKVPTAAVLAAVPRGGTGYAAIGTALGVSKQTATRYVDALGDKVVVVPGRAGGGKGSAHTIYRADDPAIATSPHDATRGDVAMPEAMSPSQRHGHHHNTTPPYRGVVMPEAMGEPIDWREALEAADPWDPENAKDDDAEGYET